jgi:hypothetical protein
MEDASRPEGRTAAGRKGELTSDVGPGWTESWTRIHVECFREPGLEEILNTGTGFTTLFKWTQDWRIS